MKWEGKYYYDKVLPFGLRSGPFLFNQLSDAIEWILKDKCAISYVCHFLDDFLIIEPRNQLGPPHQNCQNSLISMVKTFHALGVPLSAEKTVGPATELEFLGIVLDSDKMEARLPEEKMNRVKHELSHWSVRKSATLVELQSLIGLLQFPCRVVPPGRAFLQRIIDLTIGLKKPHHHVHLNQAFFADLAMWRSFLDSWNGKAFFLNDFWESSNDLSLQTDASGSIGYGGICGNQWFQGTWQPQQRIGTNNISIAWQELYAIVVACSIWGKQWACKRILFQCDNLAVVNVVNTKKAKCPQLMRLIRKLTLITMSCNCYLKAQHIPGLSNEIADSLSRFQVPRFRRLAPWADRNPQQIPAAILEL